jgi:hypothetical protein
MEDDMGSNRRRLIGAFTAGALTATASTMALLTPWSARAAPGDADTTFVPITPCRLVDTRPAPNRVGTQSSFGTADTKTFQATGSNGECSGIPTDATALSMNVTALSATQQSFLTFWGSGEQPLAASLNPAPGEPPTPNAVTSEISVAGAFNVFNNAGSVDLVIDVNGYYTTTSLASLQSQIDALSAFQAQAVPALQTDIAALQARDPFVVTAEGLAKADVTNFTPVQTGSISITAPSNGSVTVFSSATVSDSTVEAATFCSLSTTSTMSNGNGQSFQAALAGYFEGAMTVKRTVDVAAGDTLVINHLCNRYAFSGKSEVRKTQLTAIFTPAP